MTSPEAPPLAPAAGNGSTAKQHQGTDYVILERVALTEGGAEGWKQVDTATSAAGAEAAIKRSRDGKKGSFKAVPIRSWKGGLELGTETRTVTVSKPLRD